MRIPDVFKGPGPVPQAVLLPFAPVVVSVELKGNGNPRNLTPAPPDTLISLLCSPLTSHTLTQGHTFPTGHMGSASGSLDMKLGRRGQSFPSISSMGSHLAA